MALADAWLQSEGEDVERQRPMPCAIHKDAQNGLPQGLERPQRTAEIRLEHDVRAAAVSQQDATGEPHEIAKVGGKRQLDASAALPGCSDLSSAEQHLVR